MEPSKTATTEWIVPLFPLPNVVLFPGAVMPLRVFEPRYLELLKDALAGEKLIGLAGTKAGAAVSVTEVEPVPPPVHEIIGVGSIIAHSDGDDGKAHIALLGQGRYRIIEELPHEPYRLARVVKLHDRAPENATAAERLKNAHGTLLASARQIIHRTLDKEAWPQLEAALDEREPGPITDLLASIYVQDTGLRQTLLESVDVFARTRIVQAVIDKILLRLEARPPKLDYRHDDVNLN